MEIRSHRDSDSRRESRDSRSRERDYDRRDRSDRHGESYRRRDPRIEEHSFPDLYSIHRGRVNSIRAGLGAFVGINGVRRDGLVHISQLADRRVQDVEEVVQEGDIVSVKVVGVNKEENKYSLSMRLVDQETGEDLDPLHSDSLGHAHKRPAATGANAIGLGKEDSKVPGKIDPSREGFYRHAVCSQCGSRGHLSNECFAKDGVPKSYDLIKETPEEKLLMLLLADKEKREKEKGEKEKGEKRKRHKHKHHHHKHHHHKKHHHKHHKHE